MEFDQNYEYNHFLSKKVLVIVVAKEHVLVPSLQRFSRKRYFSHFKSLRKSCDRQLFVFSFTKIVVSATFSNFSPFDQESAT